MKHRLAQVTEMGYHIKDAARKLSAKILPCRPTSRHARTPSIAPFACQLPSELLPCRETSHSASGYSMALLRSAQQQPNAATFAARGMCTWQPISLAPLKALQEPNRRLLQTRASRAGAEQLMAPTPTDLVWRMCQSYSVMAGGPPIGTDNLQSATEAADACPPPGGDDKTAAGHAAAGKHILGAAKDPLKDDAQGGESDAEFDNSIGGKLMLAGCCSLEEVVVRLEEQKEYYRGLIKEGWELKECISDDYGPIYIRGLPDSDGVREHSHVAGGNEFDSVEDDDENDDEDDEEEDDEEEDSEDAAADDEEDSEFDDEEDEFAELDEDISVRGKWMLDGCCTLEEVVVRLDDEKENYRKLIKEGWELRECIQDDWGFMFGGPPDVGWVGEHSHVVDGNKFYRRAEVGQRQRKVSLGSVVALKQKGEPDAEDTMGQVQAMWKTPAGEKLVQVRVTTRGADTMLGNAASDRELVLTSQLSTRHLNEVSGVPKIKATHLQRE